MSRAGHRCHVGGRRARSRPGATGASHPARRTRAAIRGADQRPAGLATGHLQLSDGQRRSRPPAVPRPAKQRCRHRLGDRLRHRRDRVRCLLPAGGAEVDRLLRSLLGLR